MVLGPCQGENRFWEGSLPGLKKITELDFVKVLKKYNINNFNYERNLRMRFVSEFEKVHKMLVDAIAQDEIKKADVFLGQLNSLAETVEEKSIVVELSQYF